MSWSIFLLVLLAALMHATWNALVKRGEDNLATMVLVSIVASLVACSCLLAILPLPARASWSFIAPSLIAHLGYKICLLEAYRRGALSQAYPIARGGAALVVLAITAIMANEIINIKWHEVAAVLLIASSVISIAFLRGHAKMKTDAVIFALATACCIGAYSILDAQGARQAENPLSYVALLLTLDAIPITFFMLAQNYASEKSQRRQRSSARRFLKRIIHRWRYGIIGGILSLLAYAIVVYAMTIYAIAPIIALRETSVVFATLIGWLFLREKGGKARIIPALLIAFSVALLKL